MIAVPMLDKFIALVAGLSWCRVGGMDDQMSDGIGHRLEDCQEIILRNVNAAPVGPFLRRNAHILADEGACAGDFRPPGIGIFEAPNQLIYLRTRR